MAELGAAGQKTTSPARGDRWKDTASRGRGLYRIPAWQAVFPRACGARRLEPPPAAKARYYMSVAPLYISNLGLACPVGQRAVNACAAIRARINRFQESRYRDNTGEPIVCSEFTRLPANMMLRERVLALLSLAII